jgi:hypothetical protein
VIRVPTTLVLGAGASAPYGPPVGAALRRMILAECGNGNSFWMEVFKALGISLSDVAEFRDAFRRSTVPSIDAFLEHRPEFMTIGKTAIALGLIPYEHEDRIFDAATETGAWYSYLFDALRTSPDRFRGNHLSIVTFNYDRSIEYFLFNALKFTYKLS